MFVYNIYILATGFTRILGQLDEIVSNPRTFYSINEKYLPIESNKNLLVCK